ncbi:MAG: hypothetical protein IPJ54_15520 [Saprospiraceae bacterium]|nr:hypothetical protein [Saprospiraceae bacterium]
MENNKQGKLKFWADSYKPEPDAKVWQSIESRLTQEPSKRKASILTLTVLRIAAIFVFVLVSIGVFNTFITGSSNIYSMGKTMELSPLNLNDVSVYFEAQKVKDLRIAYAKLNQH